MATAQRFDRFLNNIVPRRGDIASARSRATDVGGKLHNHYYPLQVHSGSAIRIIGSYAKGTAVLPVRDVDLMFLMPPSQYRRWDSYIGNGQSALLQEIRRVLLSRYPRTDISGDGQVVVVTFQEGHSVEVLPAWRLNNGKCRTPNTHDGGSWHDADHDAEEEFLALSDGNSNGNTRSVIQMMKTWQDHCNVPIKSLALELRAVEFMKTWEHAQKGSTYHDWMVRDYLEDLIGKVGCTHVIPGTDDKYRYGSDWLSRAQTALGRAQTACSYEASDLHYLAIEEWSKIFGRQFYA